MLPILESCYAADTRCCDDYHLSEDILMEHAAMGMARYLERTGIGPQTTVLIVAGPGNNGADGIVLARLLQDRCNVALFLPKGAKSAMAKLQRKRTESLGILPLATPPAQADVIVDALFGAGLDRTLDPSVCELLETLNGMDALKIACDIPTGLDKFGKPLPVVFKADVTLTMGALKKALYSDAAKRFCGEIRVINLGISDEIYTGNSETMRLEASDFKPPLRNDPASHKGHFGHLGVVRGEKGGAAVLCATAALRFGAGLVTLVGESSPESPASLMQSTTPPEGVTALAAGMGLGRTDRPDWLIETLCETKIPAVLDADVCYAPWLCEVLERHPRVVLTPHPKEFAALLETLQIARTDVPSVQADRFGWARTFCNRYPQTVLLLKGAHTLIAEADALYVNPLGSSVLSQAGSGDLLDGLIGALLAQGYDPLEAAIQGSLALSLAAGRYEGANYSALAEDIIENLKWIAS